MNPSIIYIYLFLILSTFYASAEQLAAPDDLMFTSDTASQSEEEKPSEKQSDKYKLGIFVGPGISSTFENFADATTFGVIGFSLQVDYLLFSFRRTFSGSWLFNNDSHQDIGVLFGIVAPSDYYHLSLSIGMGYMTKIKPNIFGSPEHLGSGYGMPLAMQFYIPQSKVVLGLYGMANFNQIQSFWGVALAMQFMLNEIFDRSN